VRLRDAVGDTIDLAERDSFRLFPNTAGFQHAVILARPGPESFAEITRADGDTVRQVYYRILPGQLERIRSLVDNRDFMAARLESDTGAERSLAAFWLAIEEHPLQTMSGEPADVRNIAQTRPETNAAGDAPARTATNCESRFTCTLHGATLGSVAGGCVGAYTGYTLVKPGHYEQTECWPVYVPPLYRVDLPAVLATSIGATAVTAVAGYAFGAAKDRKPAPARLEGEGTEWRTGCAGASVLPAIALGVFAAAAANGTIFGRESDYHYNIENDPEGWSAVPAVLTGLCVSVEVVTIGYHIGRMIDRRNAEKAEAKRRALGR